MLEIPMSLYLSPELTPFKVHVAQGAGKLKTMKRTQKDVLNYPCVRVHSASQYMCSSLHHMSKYREPQAFLRQQRPNMNADIRAVPLRRTIACWD